MAGGIVTLREIERSLPWPCHHGGSLIPQGAPLLMLNPRQDADFVRRTMDLVDGAQTPESLQLALREYYPMAVVRRRGLALEGEAWYVYRDGRWVPPPEGAEGG